MNLVIPDLPQFQSPATKLHNKLWSSVSSNLTMISNAIGGEAKDSNYSTRISKLSQTVSKINKMLATNSVYPVYLEFSIGDTTFVSTNNTNYFLSFTNEKNGSGSANQFTVMIGYQPGLSVSDNGNDNTNPNYIDKLLADNTNNSCSLRYGYITTAEELITSYYYGQILDYSVEISDNLLVYTITGYSSLVRMNQRTFNFPEYEGPVKLSQIFKTVVDELLPDYEFVSRNGAYESDISIQDGHPAANDMTVFEYLDALIQEMVHESDNGDTTYDSKKVYQYIINDDDMTIELYYIDKTNNKDVEVEFDWMNRNNNMVIEFRTEFKGAVLMAQYATSNEQEEIVTESGIKSTSINGGTSVINETGTVQQHSSQGIDGTSGTIAIRSDYKSDIDQWAKSLQISYKADMITAGIPCEIPIGTKIKITPMIFGKPHHTEGIYEVLKTTDTIDESGFTTSLELFKLGAVESSGTINLSDNSEDEDQTYTPTSRSTSISDVDKNNATTKSDMIQSNLSLLGITDLKSLYGLDESSRSMNKSRNLSISPRSNIETRYENMTNINKVSNIVVTLERLNKDNVNNYEDVIAYCKSIPYNTRPHAMICSNVIYQMLPWIKSTKYANTDVILDSNIYIALVPANSMNGLVENYNRLVMLCAYLCEVFDIKPSKIIDATMSGIETIIGAERYIGSMKKSINELRKDVLSYIDQNYNMGKDMLK